MRFIGETASELALREALQAEPRAGMMGSPDEAYFLRFLLELMGAKRAVEVGVFRGEKSVPARKPSCSPTLTTLQTLLCAPLFFNARHNDAAARARRRAGR